MSHCPAEPTDVSDEKTRIIPRKQADAADKSPRRVGDKIVFFCPNGDKIVVPESLAGKRGACTKCKVAVVIPSLPRPAVVEPPVAPEDSPATEAADESPEEPLEVAEAPALPAAGPAEPPPPPSPKEWRLGADVEGSHAGLDMSAMSALPAVWSDEAATESADGVDHPAARLVARLWVERGHGGIIELHLAGGGGVILPEWYEPHWSRGTHGLFASQAVDGSVTLTAVAWDAIEKIIVRQVKGLPDGMFMAE